MIGSQWEEEPTAGAGEEKRHRFALMDLRHEGRPNKQQLSVRIAAAVGTIGKRLHRADFCECGGSADPAACLRNMISIATDDLTATGMGEARERDGGPIGISGLLDRFPDERIQRT